MSPYVVERFLLGDFSLGLVILFTALNTTYNLTTPKFPLQPGRLPWTHTGRLECQCDPSAYIHAYHQASDVARPQSSSWSPIPTAHLHKTTFLVYISVKDSILPKTLESPLTSLPSGSPRLLSHPTANPPAGPARIHRTRSLPHHRHPSASHDRSHPGESTPPPSVEALRPLCSPSECSSRGHFNKM